MAIISSVEESEISGGSAATRALQPTSGTVTYRAMTRRAPSYVGLSAASPQATAAARGASKKTGTRCEVELRRAVWRLGLRYRLASNELPGRPDLVFRSVRIAVFCDGDFWHGRDLAARIAKLNTGHNAPYWVAKITANVSRDRRQEHELQAAGWLVLRFWETDIRRAPNKIAELIARAIKHRHEHAMLAPPHND
jgi:DNA mismatch endonuclease (patch repair protein)